MQPYLARTEEGLLHDKDLCEAPTETPGPSLAKPERSEAVPLRERRARIGTTPRKKRKKRIPLRESRANHAETHVLAAAQRDRERVILRGDIRFLAE